MARVITKPFVLNLPDGSKQEFAVGQQVEGKLASHWYVEAHSEEVPTKGKASKKAEAEVAPQEQPEQQPAEQPTDAPQ